MIYYTEFSTPMCDLRLTSDGESLTGLYMLPYRGQEQDKTDNWKLDDGLPIFAKAKDQLNAYFAGELKEFDLPLKLDGLPFQKRVWTELCNIPWGETISYGELAKRIGNPLASRAVGLANGRNPISIIVPCHRVIGANGKLTGYGGGLPRKEFLLGPGRVSSCSDWQKKFRRAESLFRRGIRPCGILSMRVQDVQRLVLLASLWGGSFLFMRVAAPEFGALPTAWIRMVIASITIGLYALATRSKLELRERAVPYLVMGLLNSAIPYALFCYAELRLSASMGAILNATTPLFGAIFAAIWLKSLLTSRKLTGIFIAMVGVAMLVGWTPMAWNWETRLSLIGALTAAALYGMAGVYSKSHLQGAPAIGMALGTLIGGSLALAPAMPFVIPHAVASAPAIGCLLALGVISTGVAILLYCRLLIDVGPTNAMTVTFLTPIFGMLWSALFLHEAITLLKVASCGIILCGTSLVMGFRPNFRKNKIPA